MTQFFTHKYLLLNNPKTIKYFIDRCFKALSLRRLNFEIFILPTNRCKND